MATRSVPGDVACADTSIQMVVRIIQGKYLSLNYIRRASGNAHRVPMSVTNAAYCLRRLGLDYELRTNITAREVMQIAREKGPVLIAEDYWAHPQWKDYVYAGHKMDGKARTASGRSVYVGFSRPLERSGSNQWTFKLGHMVLVATSQRKDGKNVAYVRDPNHNSASRPQRPAWDEVNTRQLARMMHSFNRGRNIIAIVPRRRLWK